MNSINTIEGLLFRSYLSGYNLSLLHKCIKANDDDYKGERFRKSCLTCSEFQYERNISRAKELTERYLHFCQANKIKIIAHFDPFYPKDLHFSGDFPPLLFVKGNLNTTNHVAIVGTREVSPLADDKVAFLVKAFAKHDFSIISGLALGIDTLAHRAAIKNKLLTIAVIPTSIDNIYPKENILFASQIIETGGAIISEQAPNYAPVANPFVLRNRIIAALSNYLIPVEMGKDSGARHAIHYAVKYGRKLILCLPNTFEIDNSLRHYDGIIVAAKKYRKKENCNVIIVKNLEAIPALLESDKTNMHVQLF